MKTEVISHAGWWRTLRISNDHVELLVTLDVGPRVLSYKTSKGENVFKNYDDQMGGWGESEFKIRGGHRFWIAPEDEVRTYHLDNAPVEFRSDDARNEIVIDCLQAHDGKIMKSLGISLDEDSSRVTVRHSARNDGNEPIELATWGLSVMKPGGIEVIPQPPLGQHPRDLLPNRGIILWPYTDMSDPRWRFGRDFFTLQQAEGFPPTKIGLSFKEKWVAYVLGESLFLKTIEHQAGATYPDGGCNFETFSNDEMLEIESLSPLVSLAPGESISHTETWHLFHIENEVHIESEEALANWLAPFLTKSGLK